MNGSTYQKCWRFSRGPGRKVSTNRVVSGHLYEHLRIREYMAVWLKWIIRYSTLQAPSSTLLVVVVCVSITRNGMMAIQWEFATFWHWHIRFVSYLQSLVRSLSFADASQSANIMVHLSLPFAIYSANTCSHFPYWRCGRRNRWLCTSIELLA